MRVYKRAGRWWVALHGGNRRSLKLPKGSSKAEAQKAAAALVLGDDAPEPVAADPVPLSALWAIRLEIAEGKNLSRSTIDKLRGCYRHHIKPWWPDDRDVREMTPLDVERWQAAMGRRFAPGTVNGHLVRLRSVLDLGVRGGHLERNVAKEVSKLRTPRTEAVWWTPEETQALLDACRRQWPQWWPQILVMVRTGIRASEARGLRWEDVSFVERQLHVRQQITRYGTGPTKNRKPRKIPLSGDAIAALREQRLQTGMRGELVFQKKSGGPLGETTLAKRLNKITRLAGVPNYHVHALRHTFASHLVRAGVALYQVSKLLGHHDIKTTQIYAHLAPDTLAESVALLDGLSSDSCTKVVQK